MKWYNETKDGQIDWEAVNKSFNSYFDLIGEDQQCCLMINGDPFVFDYKEMKLGDGEGNYYKL